MTLNEIFFSLFLPHNIDCFQCYCFVSLCMAWRISFPHSREFLCVFFQIFSFFYFYFFIILCSAYYCSLCFWGIIKNHKIITFKRVAVVKRVWRCLWVAYGSAFARIYFIKKYHVKIGIKMNDQSIHNQWNGYHTDGEIVGCW